MNDRLRSPALSWILIPLGGFGVVALTLALFVLISFLLRRMLFSPEGGGFSQGLLRFICTAAFALVYPFLLRTKLPELIKASILAGPVCAALITARHNLYQWPEISIIAMMVIVAVCGGLLYLFKKPWIYYYGGTVGTLLAIVYLFML